MWSVPARWARIFFGASVVVALSAAACTRTDSSRGEAPADLIIVNAKVYPAGGQDRLYEALAIRGDRIAAIGTRAEVERLRGAATEVLDAQGHAVVPGFNDTHVHFFEGAFAAERADLTRAASVEDVQARLRAFAQSRPDAPWVAGEGWGYNTFPGGLPTRQQLDAVVADRPAFMRCFDYHTAWVNSKALALAGITKATPDPVNGHIVRDPITGEPTGVLQESAQGLVSKLLPAPSPEDRLRAIETTTARLHAVGVTSVQNALGSPDEFAAFDRARAAGRLQVRVYSAVAATGLFASDPPPPITEATIDAWDTVRAGYPDDDLFKLGLVKLFVDGVIETHTAKLLAPYANTSNAGPSNYTPQELNRIVALLDRRGWQVMMHAVGDGAVRMALDAVAQAAAANPTPTRGRRHRIDHIETIDAADEPRFGLLGVIASFHPGGFFPPPPGQPARTSPTPSVWSTNLGPERAARGGAWKRILAAGGRVTLGSDWPVASFDPAPRLYQVAVAPPRAGRPDGRLPVMAAIGAYTSQAAYLSFDEGRKGTLMTGQLADVVILASDVFSAPPTSPAGFGVDATVFGGKVVYRRKL